MSTAQYNRNRGSLFENGDKRKPSQPDLRGDCAIDGQTYDIQAWRRDERISLTIAPTRGKKKNTYPPDAFRGALDPAAESDTWVGDITGDEVSYTVRASEKEGKSGKYLSLYFEVAESA